MTSIPRKTLSTLALIAALSLTLASCLSDSGDASEPVVTPESMTADPGSFLPQLDDFDLPFEEYSYREVEVNDPALQVRDAFVGGVRVTYFLEDAATYDGVLDTFSVWCLEYQTERVAHSAMIQDFVISRGVVGTASEDRIVEQIGDLALANGGAASPTEFGIRVWFRHDTVFCRYIGLAFNHDPFEDVDRIARVIYARFLNGEAPGES